MKAVVFTEYGPPEVLRLEDVDRPVPDDDDVLIRVHASTVSAEDPKLRSFAHPPLLWLPMGLLLGFRRPRRPILGMDLAGEVERVGSKVTRFKKGDRVFGYTGVRLGAHAEYKCIPESGILARMPRNMTYEEAAAAPNGALTALVYLRNWAKVEPGERVLVYGASGAVGTAAVQLAKHFGAEVTGVCSTRNVELVRSLGADKVIDYTKENISEAGEVYDVFFDTVGKTSLAQIEGSLGRNGRYLVTVFGARALLQMLWTSLAGGRRVMGGASNFKWTGADLELLRELIEAGRLRSVVDRCYPLAEASAAHRYVEEGRKRGNVVLTSFKGADEAPKTMAGP